MAWESPTSHNDPDNAWSLEGQAYDGNFATAAYTTETIPSGSWSNFLEFIRTESPCDSVRVYQEYPSNEDGIYNIDVDVYYDGGWHDLYQGTFESGWNSFQTGSVQNVSKARVRYGEVDDSGSYGVITEFEFNSVAGVAVPRRRMEKY